MELANPLMSLSVDIEGSPSQTGTFLSFSFHSDLGISFHTLPCSVALEVCKCGGLKEARLGGSEDPLLSSGGSAFLLSAHLLEGAGVTFV